MVDGNKYKLQFLLFFQPSSVSLSDFITNDFLKNEFKNLTHNSQWVHQVVHSHHIEEIPVCLKSKCVKLCTWNNSVDLMKQS